MWPEEFGGEHKDAIPKKCQGFGVKPPVERTYGLDLLNVQQTDRKTAIKL